MTTGQLALAFCAMKAALVKLDDCRAACPGAGGDIDASNLRFMIGDGPQSAGLLQAAEILAVLSRALEIDAEHEVAALREVATY